MKDCVDSGSFTSVTVARILRQPREGPCSVGGLAGGRKVFVIEEEEAAKSIRDVVENEELV
jgi:hypothetical protein